MNERGITGVGEGRPTTPSDPSSQGQQEELSRELPPPWRSLRQPRARLFAWMVSFAALAHVLLTPVAGLLGLLAFVLTPPEPEGEAEQLRSIPISLLSDEELAALEAVEAPPLPPASGSEALPPEPPEPEVGRIEPPRAAPQKPPEPKPSPAPVAPASPRGRGEESGIAHPVAMTGVSAEVIDDNANVNLLLLTERVRQHPLGDRIGRLIVNFPQWSSFFESGAIHPVRDIDRLLIIGPQFRRSADVVAILQHAVGAPAIRAEIDRLVQRPPRGRWLRAKFPAARAHADRAERLFAQTAPDLLIVAPPHLEAQILENPPTAFPRPRGDEALVVHLRTPWRALIGLPFRLPESIAWLRLDVTAERDGGAFVRIAAEDADARQASDHARSLSTALNAVTNPDLGALGALVGLRSIAFVDEIQFQARGKRITGQVRITPRQLERLLVYAEEMVSSWAGRRGPPAATQPARLPARGDGRSAASKDAERP